MIRLGARKPPRRTLEQHRAFFADIAARGGDLELAAEIMAGEHDDKSWTR